MSIWPWPFVCLSVYIRTSSEFVRYQTEILNTCFSHLFIAYKLNDQFKILVWKTFYASRYLYKIWHGLLLKATLQYQTKCDHSSYSCHTNWAFELKSLYGKLFYLTKYLHEIWIGHYSMTRNNLQRNCLDRIIIAAI